MEAPGDCSPSRMVVSKTTTRSLGSWAADADGASVEIGFMWGLAVRGGWGSGRVGGPSPETPGRDEAQPEEALRGD